MTYSEAIDRAKRMASDANFINTLAAVLDEEKQAIVMIETPDPDSGLTEGEKRALDEGDLGEEFPKDGIDPIQRVVAEYSAMMDSALTVAQAAERLRVDPARVRQRLGERTLFGVKLKTAWRLPSFQFTERAGEVRGIGPVLASLDHELHPVEVKNWITTPELELEIGETPVSPRDWLLGGGSIDSVTEIAKHVGEPI
jgi:hypothetical protein